MSWPGAWEIFSRLESISPRVEYSCSLPLLSLRQLRLSEPFFLHLLRAQQQLLALIQDMTQRCTVARKVKLWQKGMVSLGWAGRERGPVEGRSVDH